MAEGRVRARVAERIALLVLDRSPANTLNAAMREALSKALEHFSVQAGVDAIVIAGEGASFSAGFDIREIGQDSATCEELCHQIEGCRLPVVVALSGAVLAGGAEIACAATARVGDDTFTLGFPQVNLGVPPSIGTVQRVTRLVGPAVAIEMLGSGRPIDHRVAAKQGLVDHFAVSDVLQETMKFARKLASVPGQVVAPKDRTEHLRNGPKFVDAVKDARKKAGRGGIKERMIDCVEAVLLLPPAAALAFEADVFADVLAHPDSVAARHMFMAERQVSSKLLAGRSDTVRSVTAQGQNVVARLFAAQDRAILALVRGGVTEREVDAAMLGHGAKIGPFGRTKFKPEDEKPFVLRRIMGAVMAEGARCVEQRVVQQPSDIDALAVHGMRLPRHRGGPMHWSAAQGLLELIKHMDQWAHEDRVWAVPDLVRTAVMTKSGFVEKAKSP